MSIIRVAKKFNSILSRHQKVRVIELTVLMLIGGLLEMCSVSLILPFMNAVKEPNAAMEEWYARFICNLLKIDNSRVFLLTASIALALLYVFKNLFLLAQFNIQYHFAYRTMLFMQNKVLNSYIHRPYEHFLRAKSGEIVRVINTDIPNSFRLLTILLTIFTEIATSAILVVMIAYIAPFVTVCMAVVLAILLLIISQTIKPILNKAGVSLQKSGAGMNKWLLQSTQGIKEVKIVSKEEYFQKNFDMYGRVYVDSTQKYEILNVAPRFLIEGFSMGAMFIIIAALIYRGGDLMGVIPMLTAVGIAAMRLLPSANRISGGIAAISYFEPMLDKMIENLEEIREIDSAESNVPAPFAEDKAIKTVQKEICFNKISFRYSDADTNVLTDASMIIRCGESVGIVGESGSGKTTAVDILLGLLHPQQGQILVDGVDIAQDMKGWRDQIGYIPQMIFMLDDTVRRNVCFGEPDGSISDEAVWHALEDASLADFVRSLPKGLDTEIGERGVRLSGGQRQRIGIARALYRDPAILVFDEATSALDNATEAEIMESIQRLQGQKTMIIIAHRLTTIEHCDHVYRVENGKIEQER